MSWQLLDRLLWNLILIMNPHDFRDPLTSPPPMLKMWSTTWYKKAKQISRTPRGWILMVLTLWPFLYFPPSLGQNTNSYELIAMKFTQWGVWMCSRAHFYSTFLLPSTFILPVFYVGHSIKSLLVPSSGQNSNAAHADISWSNMQIVIKFAEIFRLPRKQF